MKVLLLHPEDKLPPLESQGWDLIVDFGRAPTDIYEKWSKQAGCRIVSLADYANGFEDIYRLKRTLDKFNCHVIDKFGIDWWHVLLPMLSTDLEQCLMLVNLARELRESVEIYSTRRDSRASALQKFLETPRITIVPGISGLNRKINHYRRAFSQLDLNQLTQIAHDKLDSEHSIRRRFSKKKSARDRQVFLLPTAYINVSRTAVAYAELLPEDKFLLVVARPGGKLAPLPANVQMISLAPYFGAVDKTELSALIEKWKILQPQLASVSPEFRMAEALGTLDRGPELMRWGLAARDAWMRLFEAENISGCLSADDANPYTSLPLFIARQRGIPNLAVHHGALDSRMSIKPLCANFYLAKGDLEQDYLLNTCRVDPQRIIMGGPSHVLPEPVVPSKKPWLVFFTEPYTAAGWRAESVYEDLLPHLCALAEQCRLDLVFKLHPFESIKGHKNLVRKLLPRDQFETIQWFAGPLTREMWNNIGFAMTVESTIALECAVRQVPIFLCAWLQNVYGGYLQQYAKFGVGHILNSPGEMRNVPQLLANWKQCKSAADGNIWQTIKPAGLRDLLTGTYSHKTTMSAQAVTHESEH
ncbi:MAG TPA: hypothetical protein VLK33_14325 [Terriglobales bacterium]|nr:hypothetical protein [Terriglobales bacterium]